MTALSSFRTAIGRRTGRSSEFVASAESTRFNSIVDEALDRFLQEACLRHTFREMVYTDCTISITESDYYGALPTSTSAASAGFSGSIHQIESINLRKSSSETYDAVLKSSKWLDENYPDRSRTGANTGRPLYFARFGSNLHWDTPANDSYTLIMTTTHLPSATHFQDGGTSETNPIASLDSALIAFGCYEVFDSLQSQSEADRMLRRAYGLLQLAIDAERDPAMIIRAEPRAHKGGIHPDPSKMDFDEDTLTSASTYLDNSLT